MPVMLHPWSLLGLAAVPALVAIYFLYNRLKKKQVSAVFLWRDLGRKAEGSGRMRPLLPPPTFWVELAIVLLLTWAAADVCFRVRGAAVSLTVVLDDSLSMRASLGRQNARERAEDVLRQEVDRLRPTSLRGVIAGRTPTLESKPVLDRLASSWRCRSMTADLESALVSARIHAPTARVLVLSDHGPRSPVTDPLMKWVAVGEPLPNDGLFNAVRSPALTPGNDRLLVEVCRYGGKSGDAEVVVSHEGKEFRRMGVALVPGESRAVTLKVPSAGRIRVALASGGALAEDDVVEVPPAWRPMVRVRLPAGRPRLRDAFEKALRSTGMGVVVGPEEKADLMVSTAAAVQDPGQAWQVCVHAPGKAGELLTGPFIMDRSHPLCDGLGLEGSVWCGASLPPGGTPVIMAGNVVLATDTVLPTGARILDLSLDIERSTLSQSPDWPILIWNLLRWRAAASVGFGGSRALCGQPVRLVVSQPGESVSVGRPGQSPVAWHAAPGSDEIRFVPEEAGLYRAVLASGGAFELLCAAGTPEESDLTNCISGVWGGWNNPTAAQDVYRGTAVGALLAALVMLGLHTWMVRKKR